MGCIIVRAVLISSRSHVLISFKPSSNCQFSLLDYRLAVANRTSSCLNSNWEHMAFEISCEIHLRK